MPSFFLFSLYRHCSHHHFLQVGPVVTPSSPTTPPPPTCLLRCHSRYFCLCPYVSLSHSLQFCMLQCYICLVCQCYACRGTHLTFSSKFQSFFILRIFSIINYGKKSPLIVPLIFSLQKVPIFIVSGHPCIYTNMPFLDFLGLYLK